MGERGSSFYLFYQLNSFFKSQRKELQGEYPEGKWRQEEDVCKVARNSPLVV